MKAVLRRSMKVYFDDFIMTRVDKTLEDIMSEKPFSRWDAGYWHPVWETLNEIVLPLTELGELMQTKGITYGQVGKRIFSDKGKVQYLQVITLKPTGIDFFKRNDKVKEGSRNDPERSRLKPGQLLLSRTSFPEMDTLIGRCVVVPKTIGKANVSEDIDVITLKNEIIPEVVCTFLKTKYGQDQIHREKKGVKSIKINFDEICSIKIPIFYDSVTSNIKSEYNKMSKFHNKAMDAKSKGNDTIYKKNIAKAEAMLKKLIERTEAVIRGERKDVV